MGACLWVGVETLLGVRMEKANGGEEADKLGFSATETVLFMEDRWTAC